MQQKTTALRLLEASRAMSIDTSLVVMPPSETPTPVDQPVLTQSLVRGTRGYLDTVVRQINLCYSNACYDACMVMIRRVVEILLIEVFEHKGLGSEIKDSDDNYLFLNGLVLAAKQHKEWSLGRASKQGLERLKTVGDRSAHSRRYNARREDVDAVIVELRVVVEELLYLSGMKA